MYILYATDLVTQHKLSTRPQMIRVVVSVSIFWSRDLFFKHLCLGKMWEGLGLVTPLPCRKF